jgi:MFS family permease
MLIEGGSAIIVSQTNTFWALVLTVSVLRVSSPIYHMSGLSQITKIARPSATIRSIGIHNAMGSLGSAFGIISLSVFLATLGWRWAYLFWAVPMLIWGIFVLISSQLRTVRTEQAEISDIQNGNWLRRLLMIFSSGFLIFLIAIAVREIGATGSSTFMTTYFVQTRGVSQSTATLIYGLGPFIGILGSLAGGYWGERMGMKKTLNWAIAGCALGLFLILLASHVYLLALTYCVYAFFGNAVWSPMNALVARITPLTQRGLGFSLYFFIEGIVGSFAPALAAGVIELSTVWFVFPLSIGFFIASLLILHFLSNPEER